MLCGTCRLRKETTLAGECHPHEGRAHGRRAIDLVDRCRCLLAGDVSVQKVTTFLGRIGARELFREK